MLQLKLGVIRHALLAIDSLDVLTFKVRTNQTPFLGSQLLGRANDLAHDDRTGIERDEMAVAGDIDSCGILTSINRSTAIDTEEFGVEGSSKNVKSMLGNCRSDRKHEVNLALLGWNDLRG